MDGWVGSGVDELTMINEKNIRIRLPSSEADFTLEAANASPTPMFPLDGQTNHRRGELDVAAQFVLLLELRKKVLRFVKHLDETQPPYLEDSEFSVIHRSLAHWAHSLPESLQFDRSAIQKRKISGQHGALMLLHVCYHQTVCDLTRIGMPELFRIRVPFQFSPDKKDFVEGVQNVCFDSCIAVTNLFREALHHGQEMFADTWLCVVAHDSIRVIVHYLSKHLGTVARHEDVLLRETAISGLSANMQALERLIPLQALAKPLHASALATVKAAEIELPAVLSDTTEGLGMSRDEIGPRASSPAPHTPEYVLNPLAIYRMARQDIRKHEKQSVESISDEHDQQAIHQDLSTQNMQQASLPPEVASMHGDVNVADPEMGYYNGPILEAFDLPLSFDDLQAYMSLPPLLNQFNGGVTTLRPDGGSDFVFGDSTQTSGHFGSSNYGTGVGQTADMGAFGPPSGQVWME
ncbi:hypothetical protein QQS21_011859 [Conoideocrella luteorostrata]|uniref:Uncharacterized protein n=1 Tax=Conoideocrella luteorostrata TaxID=1105319 RepID=A0AAJ0FTA1_9HYPO|nr:hypothetical protein QQS21_011859 [Conoideocrella luteorostrata]